jgi:3D (Asp-Asp-Asp) domain-containing protein
LLRRAFCAALVYASLIVYPASAASPMGASAAVTGVTWQRNGVVTWERTLHRAIVPVTVHRLSFALAPGSSKIIARGEPGEREMTVRYSQRDGGPVHQLVISSTVIRMARPQVVADGIARTPLTNFEARGVMSMSYIARSALAMIATAYTADCSGCGGMTAIGRRAGYGIVAVDPRVIPLGTRLFIPGYGFAVAGDTGGAIHGDRIDLGFDSLRDAMDFGRRGVTVYRLK